jgi:hypothetical protein
MTPKQIDELKARRLRETPAKYRKTYADVMAGKGSPRRAIRIMCCACMGWEGAGKPLVKEIHDCTSHACPLFAFRPGEKSARPRKRHRLGAPEASAAPSPTSGRS